MSTSEPVKIFLAHALEDKEAIRKLYSQLTAKGFKPWLDEVDLLAGQNWRLEIPKAIKQSDIFVACFSSQSIQKNGYVQKEFRLALDTYSEKPVGTIYLIPIKLDNCQIPDLQLPQLGVSLRDIQWIDFWKTDGLARLTKAITATMPESLDQAGQSFSTFLLKINQAEQIRDWDSVIEITSLIFRDAISNAVDSAEMASVYLSRGIAYHRKRKYKEAVDDLTKAIELEPNQSDYYCERGEVFLRAKIEAKDIGDYDQAIADLYQAIRINPNTPEYYALLGGCFQMKGDYEKSISEFDHAVALAPNSSLHYCQRAAAYYDKGDEDKALADANKALSLDNQCARAYRIRGRILEEEMRFIVAARVDYQLAISSGDSEAIKDLEDLEKKAAL
jgi:tetratricopeptide (TPR) repeat protein